MDSKINELEKLVKKLQEQLERHELRLKRHSEKLNNLKYSDKRYDPE